MNWKEFLKKNWLYILPIIAVIFAVMVLSNKMSAVATGSATVTQKHNTDINTNTVSYGSGSISVSHVGTMRDFTVGKNK